MDKQSNHVSAYELGRIQGIQEAQGGKIAAIEQKVDTLLSHMNQTKGGFRILMLVGSASAAMGAVVSTASQWVIGKIPHA